MESDKNLDKLIVEQGQVFDKKQFVKISSDTVQNKFGTSFAYDDNKSILPGQAVQMPTSEDITYNKEKANDHMIQQLAMTKLQKENEAHKKLSDDQKIKDYVLKVEFYRYTNDFFVKNGYEMSGQEKRKLKRTIERAWNNGKYKFDNDQRNEILYEISKQAEQNTQKAKQPITNYNDLKSLVF